MIKSVELAQAKISVFAQNCIVARTAQKATLEMTQLRLDTPSGVPASVRAGVD
jgi:hypothetical protein